MMKNNGINISLNSYEDLFKTHEELVSEKITPVDIGELKPYEQQPFKVVMDENMNELMESINSNGVLSPVIVRPLAEGGYEILSGHRRVRACELLEIKEVPVVVKNLDDDESAILLVDSNLQREKILPSEKAFAYQMKLEAMKRQGKRVDLTSAQIGTKLRSDEILSKQVGESRNQIQRYIRLTNLIDPLLEKVDNKEIAINSAVELSYLSSKEQSNVLKVIESESATPSIAQAKKIRQFYEEKRLDKNVILSIMQEDKPRPKKIVFKKEKLKKYFPEDFTTEQMEKVIYDLLDSWHRKKNRDMER